jgi:hypothetical protein
VPWFAGSDRSELRRAWCEAWRRHREGLPLEPLQAQLADVVSGHPEYHALLEADDVAPERDWSPEEGRSNPFLHMGLHLAVREGVATDRPAGIRDLFAGMLESTGSRHEAEHVLVECLGETLWEAQRSGLPPDERAYLARAAARAGSR